MINFLSRDKYQFVKMYNFPNDYFKIAYMYFLQTIQSQKWLTKVRDNYLVGNKLRIINPQCTYIALYHKVIDVRLFTYYNARSRIKYKCFLTSTLMIYTGHTHADTDFHTPKVVNVVGTFTLDTRESLKLGEIASKWNNSRYNKVRFRGLVARNTDPRVTYMIFSNGKVIVTGAESENQCELACTKLIKKMSKLGVLRSLKPKVNFKANNVVATVYTNFGVNLQSMRNQLLIAKGQNGHFDPQCFPGLIYRMKDPKATFLVFSNGKIVMTGVQSEAKVLTCFKQFYKILKKYRVHREAPTKS